MLERRERRDACGAAKISRKHHLIEVRAKREGLSGKRQRHPPGYRHFARAVGTSKQLCWKFSDLSEGR